MVPRNSKLLQPSEKTPLISKKNEDLNEARKSIEEARKSIEIILKSWNLLIQSSSMKILTPEVMNNFRDGASLILKLCTNLKFITLDPKDVNYWKNFKKVSIECEATYDRQLEKLKLFANSVKPVVDDKKGAEEKKTGDDNVSSAFSFSPQTPTKQREGEFQVKNLELQIQALQKQVNELNERAKNQQLSIWDKCEQELQEITIASQKSLMMSQESNKHKFLVDFKAFFNQSLEDILLRKNNLPDGVSGLSWGDFFKLSWASRNAPRATPLPSASPEVFNPTKKRWGQ